METITDKNGKEIQVQYFGNLQEKLDICKGYVNTYNSIAADKQLPQLDLAKALNKIGKAHNKFYGTQSKYDGKGNLR